MRWLICFATPPRTLFPQNNSSQIEDVGKCDRGGIQSADVAGLCVSALTVDNILYCEDVYVPDKLVQRMRRMCMSGSRAYPKEFPIFQEN